MYLKSLVLKGFKSFADRSVLTLEPGPKVVSKPERVRARTWCNGEDVYALVCNTHPEPRKGVVCIDGKYSTCKTGFGGGVTLKDGALSLDMEPFGVAIVKLGDTK